MIDSPNAYIEHTNLKASLLEKDIDNLISEAKTYRFLGVCVPPFWVKKASRELSGSGIGLVTVIGFPLGYQRTESKIKEIECAIEDGADELDVVMNVSAFKSGMTWPKVEIAKCARLVHQEEKILKVIVESALLNDDELALASKIVSDSGADFIKTSTGFSLRGASLNDIRIMKKNISENVGVKASGGIKSLEGLKMMVEAGADRIGTSSGINIMKEWTD